MNGNISVDGVAGDINVNTVNGGAQIDGARSNVSFSTVNGNGEIVMTELAQDQSVTLHTVNGGLKLAIPDNADAKFYIKTLNGAIDSEFSGLKPEKKFPIGYHLEGQVGGGAANVTANTVNGSIKVTHATPETHEGTNAVSPTSI